MTTRKRTGRRAGHEPAAGDGLPEVVVPAPPGPARFFCRDGRIASGSWAVPGQRPDTMAPGVLGRLLEWFLCYNARRACPPLPPLEPEETEFRQKVRDVLLSLPAGELVSYQEVADRLGTSPRAVGNACGANRLPVIVPCHRVIGRHGDPGGYSGPLGLAGKAVLLAHEGCLSREMAAAIRRKLDQAGPRRPGVSPHPP